MVSPPVGLRRLQDIRLRDPFILPVAREGRYYLYGSTDANTWFGPGGGFDAFRSADLRRWEGPWRVFAPPPGFWGTENFWSPEVYAVDRRYVMFATFRGSGGGRGTAVLAASGPGGPFLPHSDGAVTPPGWDALDGTLFVDAAGDPWVVFCHEWRQSSDGAICARRLSPDLRHGAGEPVVLFTASQAPWSVPISEGCYVADGPFLHRSSDGSLQLLWSSFGAFGYALGIASSPSGELLGRWYHDKIPLWEADGGHGMLFETFHHDLRLILHHPNQTPYERALIVAVHEDSGRLRISKVLAPLVAVVRRFHRGGSRRQKIRFLLHAARCGAGALTAARRKSTP